MRFLTPNPTLPESRGNKTTKLNDFASAVEDKSASEPRAQALMPWIAEASRGRSDSAVFYEKAAARGLYDAGKTSDAEVNAYYAKFESVTLDLVKLGKEFAEHRPLMALNAGVLAKVLIG